VTEALDLAVRARIWSRAIKLVRMPQVAATRDHYHLVRTSFA
jgi:hypothetical protein